MSQIIDKLYTQLDAASSTLLAAARIYKYDFPTTTDADSAVWEVRLIPLPCGEGSEYMGSTGWRAPFNIHIEARRVASPNSAAVLGAACAMAEEILQVLVDNRELSISGEDEAASMSGEVAEPLKWDYGSMAEGETSYAVVNVTASWEGPQIAPS